MDLVDRLWYQANPDPIATNDGADGADVGSAEHGDTGQRDGSRRARARGGTDGDAVKREFCVVGVVPLLTGCGNSPVALVGCGRPTCAICEANRAALERERWGPVVEDMRNPKMLVLARKSEEVCGVAVKNLATAYARFLDRRIGVRARKTLLRQVAHFIWNHRAEFNRNNEDDSRRHSAREWLRSCERFLIDDLPKFERIVRHQKLQKAFGGLRAAEVGGNANEIEKWRRKVSAAKVNTIKVRDFFFGFRNLEITYNASTGKFHPHYHQTFDTRRHSMFLPWPVFEVLWMLANGGEANVSFGDPDDPGDCERDTLGRTAHISRLRNIEEAIKYVCKPNVIKGAGPAVVDELEAVLEGKKRIWPLGGAVPVEPKKLPCRYCGDPDCKWHKSTSGEFGQKVSEGADGRSQVWKNAVGELLRVFFVPGDKKSGRRGGWEWTLSPLFNSKGSLPDGRAPPKWGVPDAAQAGAGPGAAGVLCFACHQDNWAVLETGQVVCAVCHS